MVDNASTDATVTLVERASRSDKRIRLVHNDSDIGMNANFNRCLSLATGRFLKFLCADDLLDRYCVERMVAFLETRPRVSLVACARRLVHSYRVKGIAAYGRSTTIVSGPEAMNRCFFEGNLIGEPTAVMFRRTQAARGFSSDYNQALDLEMWFHLLEQGDFAFLSEPLCSIRLHEDQQTVRNLRSGRIVEDKRKLFRACLTRPWVRPTLVRKLRWDVRMASSVAKAGDVSPNGARDLEEVFFPDFFRSATLPAVRLALRFQGS